MIQELRYSIILPKETNLIITNLLNIENGRWWTGRKYKNEEIDDVDDYGLTLDDWKNIRNLRKKSR